MNTSEQKTVSSPFIEQLFFKLFSPVRALLKRGSPCFIKRAVWDSEFKRGQFLHHDLHQGYRSKICDTIEKYCCRGDILDLGCSDGHVGLGLALSKYESYLGVDISEIAVKSAFDKLSQFGNDRIGKNTFIVHDICNFDPPQKMNVIVFKDSFYYINKLEMVGVLNHYLSCLKPEGVIIIEMDNIKRHGWIADLIRSRFEVIEDLESKESDFNRVVISKNNKRP